MIYFIQGKTTELIKIGYTLNRQSFQKRVQNLSGANADALKVLGTIRGGRKTESAWHDTAKAYQVHHEWYQPNPKLMHRIRKALRDKTRRIHSTL